MPCLSAGRVVSSRFPYRTYGELPFLASTAVGLACSSASRPLFPASTDDLQSASENSSPSVWALKSLRAVEALEIQQQQREACENIRDTTAAVAAGLRPPSPSRARTLILLSRVAPPLRHLSRLNDSSVPLCCKDLRQVVVLPWTTLFRHHLSIRPSTSTAA